MRIQHNMMAMDTLRNLNSNEANLSKSLEKLSSGYRINRAADDAAGLAISNAMNMQVTGMQQSVRNSQDGVSLIQTAEGSLSDTSDILNRLHDLATQAANGTYSSGQLGNIQSEVNQLLSQIDSNANIQFNGLNLNNTAAATSAVTLQIGANSGDTLAVQLTDNTSSTLNLSNISLQSTASASAALTTIANAINTVSDNRAKLGAYQNRLEHTINNLNVNIENLQASESRIRDVDMAAEMANYTKENVLVQAAQSMLSQANQAPQSVLQLLR